MFACCMYVHVHVHVRMCMCMQENCTTVHTNLFQSWHIHSTSTSTGGARDYIAVYCNKQ
jgi:hypothetical protein